MTIKMCFLCLQNEVNAIKWDPTGNLLASCSDDMTLKVRPLTTLATLYKNSESYFHIVATRMTANMECAFRKVFRNGNAVLVI